MAFSKQRDTKAHWPLLLILLAAFVARIALTYRVFNDTVDEQGNIVAGLEYLQTGLYEFESQHPPLARVALAALPYFLADLRYTRFANKGWLWGGPWGEHDLGYYWMTLSLARAGNLVFATLIFCFVYRWSLLLFGQRAALVACLLVICCPAVIGHSGLATLDVAAAATTLVAAFFFWRWSQFPGWQHCLAAGAAFGIALLAKLSAVFFLPVLAAVYFVTSRWKGWRDADFPGRKALRLAALRGIVFFLTAGWIVWAGYAFDVGEVAPSRHRLVNPLFRDYQASGVPHLLAQAIERRTLPAPHFWEGLLDVLSHNQLGHPAYLLGRLSKNGWWYYFPVAVGLKTTLPLLALVLLSVGVSTIRRASGKLGGVVYPLQAVGAILAVSIASNLNIGIRYVLAIYPFFAILASALWSDDPPRVRRTTALAAASLLLVAWHMVESVAAHPDYLPYFNQIARGREEHFLADSNLDWGQDLARLARYAQQHRIDNFQLSYFGASSPAKLGVPYSPLSWSHPQPGWAAVSVNHLVGIEVDPRVSRWLRERRPDARVGKSIFLYYLSP